MSIDWQWLQRVLAIVASGVLFAIAVTELELALGFDLLDAPFFQSLPFAIGFAVVALAFAAFQASLSAASSRAVAGVIAFGLVVLPYNALSERPPIPVEFWKGNAGLLLDRAMTIDRRHAVVFVIAGPKESGGRPVSPREAVGADVITARLFGEPRSAFTIAPDKDQTLPINLAGDMRWAWQATPRQEGVQRLILELGTVVKNRDGTETVNNLFRQTVLVTVHPLSWYEAARHRLIGLVSGA